MRFILPVLLLIATPGFAQPASAPPAIQALIDMLHQAANREANATAEVYNLRPQVEMLNTKLGAVTKELDALKAAQATPKE